MNRFLDRKHRPVPLKREKDLEYRKRSNVRISRAGAAVRLSLPGESSDDLDWGKHRTEMWVQGVDVARKTKGSARKSAKPLFDMARPERFELPTTWFVARYSIRLSYGRIIRKYAVAAGPSQAQRGILKKIETKKRFWLFMDSRLLT